MGVYGIAVLGFFPCGIAVILISTCDIAVSSRYGVRFFIILADGVRWKKIFDGITVPYEEGEGGEHYRKKNKFRCRVSRIEKRFVKLKEKIC